MIRASSPDLPTDPTRSRIRLIALTMPALATVMLVTIIGVLLRPGLAVAFVRDSFQTMLLSMNVAQSSLNAVYTSCIPAGNRQIQPDSATRMQCRAHVRAQRA